MRYFAGLVLVISTLLIAMVSADPDPTSTCVLLKDKDRLGFDLKNVTGSVFTCKLKCERTPGCLTWAWNKYLGGMCWLKSRGGKVITRKGVLTTNFVRDTPSLVCNVFADMEAYSWSDHQGGTCWLKSAVDHAIRKRGVVSSVIVPLAEPVCVGESDTEFIGNDLAHSTAVDAGVCCSACKAFDGCKAYSWSDENGGTCFMKKSKGRAVPVAGIVSAALAGV